MPLFYSANISKRTLFLSVLLGLFLGFEVQDAFSQAQLDPAAAFWAAKSQTKSLSKEKLSIIIRLDSSAIDAPLPDYVQVGTRAGLIVTAAIDSKDFRKLRNVPGIAQIGFGRRLLADLDFCRDYLRATPVHAGQNLPQAYKGTGVVIGVIDQGFDYTHPTFRSEDGKRLRIKKVWDQEQDTLNKAPEGYSYGNDLPDSASIMNAAHDQFEDETHGTHTAGTAAGSGFLSQYGQIGMAPDADIILVSSALDDRKVIDATRYIMDYAAFVQKPCVISMSFGGWADAMDGTAALDLALDAMARDGCVLFVAMGNEGANRSNLAKTLAPSESLKTVVDFSRSAAFFDTNHPMLDVWANKNQRFKARILILTPSGQEVAQSKWISYENDLIDSTTVTYNGQVTKFKFKTYPSYASNSRPRIYIEFTERMAGVWTAIEIQSMERYADIIFHASFCNLNQDASGNILPGYSLGTNKYSTRFPATANTVMAIGASFGRGNFTTVSNTTNSLPNFVENGVAPFSSRGPADDGRQKPDVMAVGAMVVASWSSYDTKLDLKNAREMSTYNGRSYYYGPLSGTSMSTPMAAGIGALIMQAWPTINYGQMRHILSTTTFVNNTSADFGDWDGSGIIDAHAAIQKAISIKNTGIGADPYFLVYPNPVLDQMTIQIPNYRSSKLHVEIFSSIGQKVYQSEFYINSSHTLTELNTLSSGLYFLKLHDGVNSRTLRFVKE